MDGLADESAMDHYSILDHSSPSPALQGETSGVSAPGIASTSVSAAIAAANALLPAPPDTASRFPGEDAGHSLAEMAHHDLDAALQLLAERAQYITGASGTAIALRRGEHSDMLCRAAAGSNAPELGAVLSMEYGLSGECVRARQPLRCDDVQRDPRVNREACRALGIASVVVMPILTDDQVLGVFELLSGKPSAFNERDLSALLRLSEMVGTAVKHALPLEIAPQVSESMVEESVLKESVLEKSIAEKAIAEKIIAEKTIAEKTIVETTRPVEPVLAPSPEAPQPDSIPVAVSAAPSIAPQSLVAASPAIPQPEPPPAKPAAADLAPPEKKPLFWSAAMRTSNSETPKPTAEASAVPPYLRNLQKCQACGFPVSQGRTFCVECEEKQWRGQPLASSRANQRPSQPGQPNSKPAVAPPEPKPTPAQPAASTQLSIPASAAADNKLASPVAKPEPVSTPLQPRPIAPAAIEPATTPQTSATTSSSSPAVADAPDHAHSPVDAAPFLSSALPSESWFASNKYILGALLLVAIVIAAIAWLR